MIEKQPFDADKYINEQSNYILERVNNYNKLYIEFGGKLINDKHAARILPGFDENAKIKLLHKLRYKTEIIICVYAGDIEKNRIHGDFGITYDMDVLRLIDEFKEYELSVNSVVITRYTKQPSAESFIKKLKKHGITVYTHYPINGYPSDLEKIVSDEGYGKNSYIKTTKPIVVVTGPGSGSGKLATCLSQLYHDNKNGILSGYAKFETFPVWNLPLSHPVNIAYEAATVDIKDINMIDHFHMENYGITAVSYNRDLEIFPVVKKMIEKITNKPSIYKSPTDMGVNRVGLCIVDDEKVKEASKQEVIRRFFNTKCDFKKGLIDKDAVDRLATLMQDLSLLETDRKPVQSAREYSSKNNNIPVVSFYLSNGTIVTGKSSLLMDAISATIINSIKMLAGISDDIYLLSPLILETIQNLKTKNLKNKHKRLNANEILIALSICAVTNPTAELAFNTLPMLKHTIAHSTVILPNDDIQLLNNLGIDITCDDVYQNNNLYYI